MVHRDTVLGGVAASCAASGLISFLVNVTTDRPVPRTSGTACDRAIDEKVDTLHTANMWMQLAGGLVCAVAAAGFLYMHSPEVGYGASGVYTLLSILGFVYLARVAIRDGECNATAAP